MVDQPKSEPDVSSSSPSASSLFPTSSAPIPLAFPSAPQPAHHFIYPASYPHVAYPQHPTAVQFEQHTMLANPHHAASAQQPWAYGPQGSPPGAAHHHQQPAALSGHGYAISPFARPPMHPMVNHSMHYIPSAYHVHSGPRHSVPTESWSYPAGASAYSHDHQHHQPHAHHTALPHHPHASVRQSSPTQQEPTVLAKASKKRSRSPSQSDKISSAKRPSGPEKRNSSSAGTAKVVEKDGQTTTIFQCRGFGDCNMTFTRSEHLARHIRKHTGERPFQCHCGKAFSRLDNLRQHAQTVHSEEADRNEAMMQELTNLHAHLAASAAQAQHAQALVVANQQGHAAAAAAAAAGSSGLPSTSTMPPAAKRTSKVGKPESFSTASAPYRLNGEAAIANGASNSTPGSGAGGEGANGASSSAVPDEQRMASTHGALPSAQLADSTTSYDPSAFPAYNHGRMQQPQQAMPYRNADGSLPPHHYGAASDQPQASLHGYGVGPTQRASYPFDPQTDAAAQHYHPYSRFASSHGREEGQVQQQQPGQSDAEAHARWAQMQHHGGGEASTAAVRSDSQPLSQRQNAAEVSPTTASALPPPAPPSGPFGLFNETYTGFQSTLSANQVRTSTLAKAHPMSPGLTTTGSQSRPLTATDRPILPPLSGSRPGTSQGSFGALLPPLSPTQLPPLRPGSSAGAGTGGGGATGWSSRPPTASGDLGKAFRFQRRSSMLDLPEMNLGSRPVSSQGRHDAGGSSGSAAMPPPEGAPPSRAGLINSRGSFSLAPFAASSMSSSQQQQRPPSSDRLRPLSSSGRLGHNVGSAHGSFDPFGRRASVEYSHPPIAGCSPPSSSIALGHHSSSSPFRFQPPPLSRDGASSSHTAAATFFRERPLTSHLSRIPSAEGGTPRRTARFAEGDEEERQSATRSHNLQQRRVSLGTGEANKEAAEERRPTTMASSSSSSGVAALIKKRPLTSGSGGDASTALGAPPRFGASIARQIIQQATGSSRASDSAGNGTSSSRDAEGESEVDESPAVEERKSGQGARDEEEEEERKRPDSSRRVSIASLVGMD